MLTNFHQVDVFQHKKPQLAITAMNYRTCNRPNDTWKTERGLRGMENKFGREHQLVASAGNGGEIYG